MTGAGGQQSAKSILVKTADEIKIMQDANQIVAETLSMLLDRSEERRVGKEC